MAIMGSPGWLGKLIESYDQTADDYAKYFFDELSRKPYDRDLLKRFAESLPCNGPVCDMGCGPGHLAKYLRSSGIDAFGLDLSREMIRVARERNPRIDFQICDMLELGIRDGSLAGIAAFYAIIHIERGKIGKVFDEIFRILIPGGSVLLSFHEGEDELFADDWEGRKIFWIASLFNLAEITEAMTRAGFSVELAEVRDPYEFEYPTKRAYILAGKPSFKSAER